MDLRERIAKQWALVVGTWEQCKSKNGVCFSSVEAGGDSVALRHARSHPSARMSVLFASEEETRIRCL